MNAAIHGCIAHVAIGFVIDGIAKCSRFDIFRRTMVRVDASSIDLNES